MSKNTYTAENGFVITDDIVDKQAEEAEDNFPGATITEFAGRAWEDETQPLKPRTVRLSDTVWHLIEADVKRRKMTVSAWTRNAILNELSSEIAAQRQLRKNSYAKIVADFVMQRVAKMWHNRKACDWRRNPLAQHSNTRCGRKLQNGFIATFRKCFTSVRSDYRRVCSNHLNRLYKKEEPYYGSEKESLRAY